MTVWGLPSLSFRHGVVATLGIGVAAEDAPNGEGAPYDYSPFPYRFNTIHGAGGAKSAYSLTFIGTYKFTVCLHGQQK